MFLNNKNESQDMDFNLLTNNDQISHRLEYTYENYIIVIGIIDDNLNINIEKKIPNCYPTQIYEKSFTQNELIEINRVFTMCDKVEDCIQIIEINNKNFSISIEENICIFTIKLDTKELPRNKISDKIIFRIPSIKCISNHINYNNILNGTNCSDELKTLIQILINKIDALSNENKEIKEKIKNLEDTNTKLLEMIKDNRVSNTNENKGYYSPSTNNTNNQNNNIEYNILNYNDFFSKEKENDNNSDKIEFKYLQGKIKKPDDFNKIDIEKQNFKNVKSKVGAQKKNDDNMCFDSDSDNVHIKNNCEQNNKINYCRSSNNIIFVDEIEEDNKDKFETENFYQNKKNGEAMISRNSSLCGVFKRPKI